MTRAADLAKLIAGGGTITVADNSDTLTLESTDADANVGPVLNLHRNSASPADGDLTGRIVFKADDDAGNAATFARIEATAVDVSNGGEDGRLDFFTAKDDAFTAALSISGTDVGIGTTSPSRTFHVSSSSGTAVKVETSDNDKGLIEFSNNGSSTTSFLGSADNDMQFGTGGSERMRIDSSGNVGIGVTAPSDSTNNGDNLVIGGESNVGMSFLSNATSGNGAIYFADGTSGTAAYRGILSYSHSDDAMDFGTASTAARMRIDSSGNVGIGTTSPYAIRQTTQDTTNAIGLAIANSSDDGSADSVGISFALARSGGLLFGIEGIRMQKEQAFTGTPSTIDSALIFQTISDETTSEKMRIDSSGNILFGCTSTSAPSFSFNPDSGGGKIVSIKDSTNSRTHYEFHNPNGTVGSITTSSSSTAFNTSSDYRLKENIVTDWDATTRLKQLKPSRFNFKTDKDTTVDGFLAHEAQAVVPESVTGTKDEVDEDGNAVMQGIDQSKLVPLMVKTIQELEARIATLESK